MAGATVVVMAEATAAVTTADTVTLKLGFGAAVC